jgi:hypothetical protein
MKVATLLTSATYPRDKVHGNGFITESQEEAKFEK